MRIIRIFPFLFLAVFLSACGSTSNIKSKDQSASIPDFSHYNRVIVKDFTNGVKGKSKNKMAAGKIFADIIAKNIKAEKAFDIVERNTESEEHALIIEGKITQLEEGSPFARMMIGFVGNSHFDAEVQFRDNQTKELLANIDVNKMSWPLGGVISASQNVESHMTSAASKICCECKKAKKAKNNI
ncbi:MAG: DUF4410 domain-containing protein [Rickettsiaceae bacterium]|nr:DUF4410 domain-containing protein [Rickettsiaceae bacterium]